MGSLFFLWLIKNSLKWAFCKILYKKWKRSNLGIFALDGIFRSSLSQKVEEIKEICHSIFFMIYKSKFLCFHYILPMTIITVPPLNYIVRNQTFLKFTLYLHFVYMITVTPLNIIITHLVEIKLFSNLPFTYIFV
jgi:hypothetical protein